jgi:hypothetical protein
MSTSKYSCRRLARCGTITNVLDQIGSAARPLARMEHRALGTTQYAITPFDDALELCAELARLGTHLHQSIGIESPELVDRSNAEPDIWKVRVHISRTHRLALLLACIHAVTRNTGVVRLCGLLVLWKGRVEDTEERRWILDPELGALDVALLEAPGAVDAHLLHMERLPWHSVGRELVGQGEVENGALVDSLALFRRHVAFPERALHVELLSKVIERLLQQRVLLDTASCFWVFALFFLGAIVFGVRLLLLGFLLGLRTSLLPDKIPQNSDPYSLGLIRKYFSEGSHSDSGGGAPQMPSRELNGPCSEVIETG